MISEGTLTIGDIARAAGVNTETIRYYESIGLLRQPAKPPRGWRRYGPDAEQRIRFIKRAQQLGFSLAEIKKLLRLRTSENPRTCANVAEEVVGGGGRESSRSRVDDPATLLALLPRSAMVSYAADPVDDPTAAAAGHKVGADLLVETEPLSSVSWLS